MLFVVATVAMVADDESQDRLLDLTLIVREVTTFLFVAIFIVATQAVRAGRVAPPAAQP